MLTNLTHPLDTRKWRCRKGSWLALVIQEVSNLEFELLDPHPLCYHWYGWHDMGSLTGDKGRDSHPTKKYGFPLPWCSAASEMGTTYFHPSTTSHYTTSQMSPVQECILANKMEMEVIYNATSGHNSHNLQSGDPRTSKGYCEDLMKYLIQMLLTQCLPCTQHLTRASTFSPEGRHKAIHTVWFHSHDAQEQSVSERNQIVAWRENWVQKEHKGTFWGDGNILSKLTESCT